MTKEFKRHFDEDFFQKNKQELKKIIETTKDFYGQVDFQIRGENCFTLYHLGQRIGGVQPKNKKFRITVRNSFEPQKYFSKTLIDNAKISISKNEKDCHLELEKPSHYFSKSYIENVCKKIKQNNPQSEKQIQQKILVDNISNPDFFIIDSEVIVPSCGAGRLDLLGLRKIQNNTY